MQFGPPKCDGRGLALALLGYPVIRRQRYVAANLPSIRTPSVAAEFLLVAK
jgi:hypothetical protein